MAHFLSKGHSSHVLRFILDKVNDDPDDGDEPLVEDEGWRFVDAMEGRR